MPLLHWAPFIKERKDSKGETIPSFSHSLYKLLAFPPFNLLSALTRKVALPPLPVSSFTPPPLLKLWRSPLGW